MPLPPSLQVSVADIPRSILLMTSVLGAGPLSHSVIHLKLRLLEEGMAAMDRERARLVIAYTSDILAYMAVLNPGVSKLRGRLLFCMAKAQSLLLQGSKASKEDLDKAKREILKQNLQAHKMISGHCL